ncbi:MAG: transcriptional regulator [Acidobacteria bacterium]|nr:transcriptional regulator [Acidobacteriota bacterium]
MKSSAPGTRYRFGEFVLSPSRRTLERGGREVPLIPRYFDLLLLLVERREEAVSRRVILDTVWSDVIVSDGALSQAIRTVRRALGDDSREQRFIRTVSRHGYRFVHPGVLAEPDVPPPAAPAAAPAGAAARETGEPDPFAAPLARLLGAGPESNDDDPDDGRREAAELLHGLGTAEALRRLRERPGAAGARALLRDARWDVPGAGPVPVLGEPEPVATAVALARLRLRRARRLAARRGGSAAAGGALAGLVAGTAGAALLYGLPGATAGAGLFPVLALVGAAVGGLGAAGVGAGLASAEAVFRLRRAAALVAGGALGGGAVGALAHAAGQLLVRGVFGRDLSPLGGALEGVVLGGAAGLGYALATPRAGGGMATPRGGRRLAVAAATGLACALAAALLALAGRHLGAMSLDLLAHTFPDSQVGLDPLAHALGEPQAGRLTASLISAFEGLMFGFGLALGLTRRPH